MQESRLFQIVYHLLDKGRATAPELAGKFEVSVRTIYRDIDALSAAGIPVYTETGRNGGIRLMSGFVPEQAVLSEEEKREILTALQSIRPTRNVSDGRTLQKLSAIFHLRCEDWLEVDFSRWGNQKTDAEKFETLKSAVIHCKCIRIRYAGACGDVGERVVQPLKLCYKSKEWYLKAFCTERQDWRIFKLNRILSLETLDERFLYREFPASVDDAAGKYRRIMLRFPSEMAYRVYDEFDETQVWQQENGDLVASAEMPEDAWLIGFLLSFGAQAEVIAPASLKTVLAEQAKLIYEKNRP